MDDSLDDMTRCARRCERVVRQFDAEPVKSMVERLMGAVGNLRNAWSGSFIGYHSRIYTATLQPAGPGEHFDVEWGGMQVFSNRTTGQWGQFAYEQVHGEILRQARVSDLKPIEDAVTETQPVFEECKEQLLPTFDALIATYPADETLKDLRDKIANLQSFIARDDFVTDQMPKSGTFWSRDSTAMSQGIQAPPHLLFYGWLMAKTSYRFQVAQLGKYTMHAVRYLQQRHKMKGKTIAKKDGKIFIGHGRSNAWLHLQNFIRDNLGLVPDEFNREPVAGKSNKERLNAMLDDASFAFLVMTAEDERADGTKHARENVVHEAGLFQGRLGFERAIVLLEDGCNEFSNIEGIGQIRFPKDNVMAKSEEIRGVLKREGIIG